MCRQPTMNHHETITYHDGMTEIEFEVFARWYATNDDAEGEAVVRGLASSASRCRPRSLLLAEKRVSALDDVIRALPAHAPVYVARQAVLDRIAATRSLSKAQLLAEIDAGRGRRPLASACRLLALDWVADNGHAA